MDESALTNQAIAELMLEIEGPKSALTSHKQVERKVNPLGKTNKRFLGRTINTAIRHNRREDERTHANCLRKLKDLDDIHERRKSNYFYNRDASSNSRRSRSRSRSSSRSRSRRRLKKSKKRRSRKRSSSRSKSRSRSRSHRRKKNKKKTRKHRKSHHRSSRRSSSNSNDWNPSPSAAVPAVVSSPSELYLEHSKRMALAVAMAYGQVLNANPQKAPAKERESSPMGDIVKELMSDGGEENPDQIDALSISSSDSEDNVLTIDVSSNSNSNSPTGSSGTESDAASSAGSCVALDQSELDNNNSDIEIIECQDDKKERVPEVASKKQEVNENAALESVDLTED